MMKFLSQLKLCFRPDRITASEAPPSEDTGSRMNSSSTAQPWRPKLSVIMEDSVVQVFDENAERKPEPKLSRSKCLRTRKAIV
ncbi:hypothetical protein O6P43_000621 [Quillaja saponaria]|uniref:Uncharacterized protein n=1 Tax=Quillaja saponaria TaxID=32244 RepID=A0AAD7QH23_QUISA|nr:hypothetical protein O6P43_000621 [Quillaja saponaria]